MIVDDIPLTQARLLSKKQSDESTISLRLVFTSNVDAAKLVNLSFKRQPNKEWKLSVPPLAIASYASELGISIQASIR